LAYWLTAPFVPCGFLKLCIGEKSDEVTHGSLLLYNCKSFRRLETSKGYLLKYKIKIKRTFFQKTAQKFPLSSSSRYLSRKKPHLVRLSLYNCAAGGGDCCGGRGSCSDQPASPSLHPPGSLHHQAIPRQVLPKDFAVKDMTLADIFKNLKKRKKFF